ncbi:J domain-containing protein DDB_G0295729 [Agrilus planipennis]|uniref:J domain-containing protein DDB_G0295729 n=1 Tax=Agrilus planipennis TaxID=224129 RepID=A0A1W4WL71_AGRPL|nr:J domain-containing protein DDB_G0295729 [Agrilus planipennis]
MANAERDLLPKTGKVNEMCREWLVREDGALAYQLQNQEITEHYKGNKQRNALVREDFPRAVDEQLREKQLAEQAAMVYHQMLEEQEKVDSQYAKELAQKLEWEEKIKKQALQMQDQFLAKQIHEEVTQYTEMEFPNRPNILISPHQNRPNDWSSNSYHCHTPRRQAKPMPLPNTSPNKQLTSPSNNAISSDVYGYADPYLDSNVVPSAEIYTYSEVYRNADELSTDLNRLKIVEDSLPADELIRRKMQEEKDAQLARELQERENIQLDRDRLLAIEAQDKELAKLLQEKERQKVKRARERAKQKSLMKKQQQKSEMDQSICPDESYSDPVDLIPNPAPSENVVIKTPLVGPSDDIVSYSLPADVVKGDNQFKHRLPTSAFKETNNSPDCIQESNIQLSSPSRPTNLSLKSVSRKHGTNDNNGDSPPSQNESPSKQMSNIAIAIDPTYNRRSQHFSRSSKGSPSVAPSSTSSSSSPNTFEEQETSPVPPYMPIQGQRRTSSLEKKHKKKVKDGCKQQ